LAVANYTSYTVSILPGNGDGTFQPQSGFAAGAEPISLAAGDFNGNGKADLAVAGKSGNAVTILINTAR
jgi:hypothetical protein